MRIHKEKERKTRYVRIHSRISKEEAVKINLKAHTAIQGSTALPRTVHEKRLDKRFLSRLEKKINRGQKPSGRDLMYLNFLRREYNVDKR